MRCGIPQQLTGSGTTCPAGASGTPNDSNGVNNNCFDDWEVQFGQSRNSGATFRLSDVKELVHIGSLCTQGLNCTVNNGNRNLLDFFQVALDPAGAANVAFADDVSGTVNIEYTRQCAGVPAPRAVSRSPIPAKRSCPRLLRHIRSAASRPMATWPRVATDPAGDAINPTGAGGDTTPVDITNVQVRVTGTNLTTILTIANLATDPPTPITGTSDTYYYVAWQTAGTWWATLASEPQPDSMAFTLRELRHEHQPAHHLQRDDRDHHHGFARDDHHHRPAQRVGKPDDPSHQGQRLQCGRAGAARRRQQRRRCGRHGPGVHAS